MQGLIVNQKGQIILENFEDDMHCTAYLAGLRMGMRDLTAARTAGKKISYFQARARDDARFKEAEIEATREGTAFLDDHLRRKATERDIPGEFNALRLILEQRDASYRPRTAHEISIGDLPLDDIQRATRLQALLAVANERMAAAEVVDGEFTEIPSDVADLL